MLLVILSVFNLNAQTTITYTTPGTTTLTAPECVTEVTVQAWGGGGGAMIHNNAAGGTSHRSVPGGAGARGEVRIVFSAPPIIIPVFNEISPICAGDPLPPICAGDTAPVLPSVSQNGINGTWTPPTVRNTIAGTYISNPNPGQYAQPVTLNTTISTSTNTSVISAIN